MRVKRELERLEAAGRLFALNAEKLREALEERPEAIPRVAERVRAIGEELDRLAVELYELLVREAKPQEDNSAKTLRELFF